MEYFGHKADDGQLQKLIDHLKGTADLAKEFASALQAGDYGYLAGILHDIGKYSAGFQDHLLKDAPRLDHSTAGAKEANSRYKNPALAFCIAGHHSGLPDLGAKTSDNDGTLFARLKKELTGKYDYQAFKNEATLPKAAPSAPPPNLLPLYRAGSGEKENLNYAAAFFIRMLYSCLVDADYLDTERFMKNGEVGRGGFSPMKELLEKFDRYMAGIRSQKENDTPVGKNEAINAKRNEIQAKCREMAASPAGIFNLTVPTGGGKTLASLAFALDHAEHNNLRRIIYVCPYTSIISQTAKEYREIFGEENVVEHHIRADYDSPAEEGREDKEEAALKERQKLAAENWDAPIIVTTNVQFFESLYANRSSRSRKRHSIAKSVVIFDEAQMIPIDHLRPCVMAIRELVSHYGVTAVLCTATQPSLDPFLAPLKPVEIIGDPKGLYEFFRRVSYENDGELPIDELASRLNAERQALCIVNRIDTAQAIYKKLDEENSFHLSTRMYSVHRDAVLEKIRQLLQDGRPCRVVATSLIEAGVDVDFPTVYRELAGLDNIIQAAGRCNREGKNAAADSRVRIFSLPLDETKLPSYILKPRASTESVLRQCAKSGEDFSSVGAIESYFKNLYHLKGDEALDKTNAIAKTIEMKFKTVGEKFRLIDDDARTILVAVVPSAIPEAKELRGEIDGIIGELKRGGHSRELLRQAAKFCVGVYEYQYAKLIAAGKVEMLDENISLLLDENAYDENCGLIIDMSEGQAVFV